MNLQEHVSLAPLTTFKIGGVARFFVDCATTAEIQEALAFAELRNLSIFILGGGSNILISDSGFDGLVIKISLSGIIEETIDENTIRVIAGAGENWDTFVAYTVSKKLYGIENLSLIPGMVGATPVQNIGAYGVEVKDTIDWVEVFDFKDKTLKKLSNTQCQFGYRDSYFKHEGKGLVVTRVAFMLSKTEKLSLDYKDLVNYFAEKKILATLESVRQAVIEIRTIKLPDIKILGTAGSFFKNPIIAKSAYEQLRKTYPEMPAFPIDAQTVKIPAAWLLDKVCGFKGTRRGAIGVYENQALVLVNFGGGTAAEIKHLAADMIFEVLDKTGITLEREVEYVGK
jgi:UDP-N-acetylmuramate dehydrogenase